jgi:hypothetical protein
MRTTTAMKKIEDHKERKYSPKPDSSEGLILRAIQEWGYRVKDFSVEEGPRDSEIWKIVLLKRVRP